MKKVLAIILVLVMALSLMACNNGSSGNVNQPSNAPASTAPSNSPVTTNSPVPTGVGVAPEPPPEDARFADHIEIMMDAMVTAVIDAFSPAGNVASTHWIYTMITDKLIEYIETDGTYGPQLATSWETEDNQTYTFHLRDDVTFHNGDHFTAEDVKWTIEISHEFPGSIVADRWGDVAEANVIDPYTIELVLNGPNPGFYASLVWPVSGIYSSRAYREQPDTWTWIGTGPWMVTDFSTGAYTELTRNDNFWGELSPTKTITFRNVIEEAVRPVMMLNGDFHYSLGINPDDLDMFDGNPDFQLVPRRLSAPICVCFNMTDPLMSDYNFRMAVIHSLNGAEIGLVSEGARGFSEKLDGGQWGYATPYRNQDIPRPQQDLELAKEYLANSAWNGETVEIANPGAALSRAAGMVQAQIEQIGIKSEVNTMDQPSLMSYLAFGNNQSQIHTFTFASDPSPFTSVKNNYTASSSNRTSYTNPKVDELLAKAESSVDPEVHRAAFYEIQEVVAQDYPHFAMFWKDFVDVARSNVGGYILSSQSQFHNFRGIYMTEN